ncbi:hypothetical protein [Microtetraspora malaysiensis]|uniref:hypothetical protein n=1 Tax=Microtetraspora malaysiensis TaxID=161358 RepID=UPI003D938A64
MPARVLRHAGVAEQPLKQRGVGDRSLICRDTENEAKDFFFHVLDRGDWEVVRMVSGGFGAGAGRSARSSSCPGRLLAARAA